MLTTGIFIRTMKLTVEQLKRIVRRVLAEAAVAEEEELLTEPDTPPEDEENQEEISAGGVAGYALPLGAAPAGYNRKRFVKSARASFGGEK